MPNKQSQIIELTSNSGDAVVEAMHSVITENKLAATDAIRAIEAHLGVIKEGLEFTKGYYIASDNAAIVTHAAQLASSLSAIYSQLTALECLVESKGIRLD